MQATGFGPLATTQPVVVANRLDARSEENFIAHARANPSKLTYASVAVARRVCVKQRKLSAKLQNANAICNSDPRWLTAAIGVGKRILNLSSHWGARLVVEMEATSQAIFSHSCFDQQAIDEFLSGTPCRYDRARPR